MNNVKPGDRAIVIRANNPKNLSIVCEVISEAQDGDIVDGALFHKLPTDGVVWVCESLGRPFVMAIAPEFIELVRHQVWPGLDRNLRKLEPPVDEPEVITAPAELETHK